MTVEDIQQMCDDHEVAIGYLGWATRRADGSTRRADGSTRTWACTIIPTQTTRRWRREEFAIRGKGTTMLAALEDAATQLAVFLLSREEETQADD